MNYEQNNIAIEVELINTKLEELMVSVKQKIQFYERRVGSGELVEHSNLSPQIAKK